MHDLYSKPGRPRRVPRGVQKASGDTIAGESLDDDEAEDGGDLPTPKAGDYVQWASQGVDQFEQPRKVVGIADGGEWAFVEGGSTGVAMSELTVVDPPASADVGNPKPPLPKGAPPANPFFKPPLAAPEGPRIEFPLPNDNAIEIRLKKPVSKKDFERIKKLVELSEDSLVGSE